MRCWSAPSCTCSTPAQSFLGLYRDLTMAEVTSRCDWRIADLISAKHPVFLYLVVPPSDISRTKPLIHAKRGKWISFCAQVN